MMLQRKIFQSENKQSIDSLSPIHRNSNNHSLDSKPIKLYQPSNRTSNHNIIPSRPNTTQNHNNQRISLINKNEQSSPKPYQYQQEKNSLLLKSYQQYSADKQMSDNNIYRRKRQLQQQQKLSKVQQLSPQVKRRSYSRNEERTNYLLEGGQSMRKVKENNFGKLSYNERNYSKTKENVDLVNGGNDSPVFRNDGNKNYGRIQAQQYANNNNYVTVTEIPRTDYNAYSNSNNIQPIVGMAQHLHSSSPSEYQLLLEYELTRQREKNEILQKRLVNKQEFIREMKHIQEDLTVAYAKCQQELNQANTLIYELKTSNTRQIRDYKEQIQELKHQIHQLQFGSHNIQNNNKISQNNSEVNTISRKGSLNRLQSICYGNDSFSKKVEEQRRYLKSKSTINLNTRLNTNSNQSTTGLVNNNRMTIKDSLVKSKLVLGTAQVNNNANSKQSKLVLHSKMQQSSNHNSNQDIHKNKIKAQFQQKQQNISQYHQISPLTSQYSSIAHNLPQKHTQLINNILPHLENYTQFQYEILTNLTKVSKFIEQFIHMCEKMAHFQKNQLQLLDQLENGQKENMKQKEGKGKQKIKVMHLLKKYWKFIKQAMKEWIEIKNQQQQNKFIKSKTSPNQNNI